MHFKRKDIINLFENKSYDKAFELFQKQGFMYECGYCKFIQGDIKTAKRIWESIKEDSPAIKWGLNTIELIHLTIPKYLSFFQIRNFLERDLDLLLKNNQLKYAENIISAVDILSEYNPETHKFIGRVLLKNGYITQAYEFLDKARDICYSDPEVHYLLAEYYLLKNDKHSAIKVLKKSISINPEYFPAKNLLLKIQE